MSDITAYRDALAEVLDLAGTHAVQILVGKAPLDPTILLATVNAAGSLPGPASRRVLDALGPHRDVLDEALGHLDLTPPSTDLDGPADELEDRFQRLLTLGTLAAHAGPQIRAELKRVLERNVVIAVCEPARVAALDDLAHFLDEALALPPGHLARPLLEAVQDAPIVAATAFEPGAFERAVDKGRQATTPYVQVTPTEVDAPANVVYLADFRIRTPSARVAQLRAAADGGAPDVPAAAWALVHETDEFCVEIAELPSTGGSTAVFLGVQTRSGSVHDLTRAGQPDGPRLEVTYEDGSRATTSAPHCTARVWTVQLGPPGPWNVTVHLGETTVRVPIRASASE